MQAWCTGKPVFVYHGMTKRQRERMLRDVALGGGVMLTTYGMLSNNWEALDQVECVIPLPPLRAV